MTIDLDKLASDIVGAIWDDYEDEKIVTRSRWEEIVKKAAEPHIEKMLSPPGGYGVGAFMVPVGREFNWGNHPLLPDED